MMSPDQASLLEEARAAMAASHSPYSRYPVGAAVRASDGRVFRGCNVENASYGLTLCAERAAVAAAVCGGVKAIDAVAVVARGTDLPYPCGACRQVLAEFCGADVPVTVAVAGRAEATQTVTLGELLPLAFRLGREKR
jgi:cytidine deaminase